MKLTGLIRKSWAFPKAGKTWRLGADAPLPDSCCYLNCSHRIFIPPLGKPSFQAGPALPNGIVHLIQCSDLVYLAGQKPDEALNAACLR